MSSREARSASSEETRILQRLLLRKMNSHLIPCFRTSLLPALLQLFEPFKSQAHYKAS
jgi:hypothetical protein